MTPQVQPITAAEEHQVVVAHTVADPMAVLAVVLAAVLVAVLVVAEADRLVEVEEDNLSFLFKKQKKQNSN